MTLRIVGAGLGRTGTHSLKLALEQLLSGRCYHMLEVFERERDITVWQAAAAGDSPDWNAFLGEYVAARRGLLGRAVGGESRRRGAAVRPRRRRLVDELLEHHLLR